MNQHVPVVWSPETLRHDPRNELWVGKSTPAAEVANRVSVIKDALTAAGHPLVPAESHADGALLAVHDRAMVEFLAAAADRWAAGPYVELVGQDLALPYLFSTPAFTAGLPVRHATTVHVELGTFAYDTMTPVGPGTWPAARAAVDCALTAADLVVAGTPLAYALTRPPGHHATPAGFGGSCYLNNAAVTAVALREGGHERVAIVDVDAHQGNGTAAIFYDRADVLYGSVHVDPAAGWFPHVVGHADETGTGEGRSWTRNLPLPPGTTDDPWVDAVGALGQWVQEAGCTALVVSLGVDAAADDPESPLLVTEEGYRAAGALLGATGLPAVAVQEGGYHLPTLGPLVAAYLSGHAAGLRLAEDVAAP